MQESSKRGVLYVITCAAQSSEPQSIEDFVAFAQAENWDIYVIATPQGTKFIDMPLLEAKTGHKVRFEYRHPQEPNVFPEADAIIVLPLTFNTINKWALGITDTLALGLLCEYMGLEKPIVAIPCVQEVMAKHPVFLKNVELLRDCGVHILYNPQVYPPMNNVPWKIILQTLDRALRTAVSSL